MGRGWVGSQPHTAVHGACGHQYMFACNIHTDHCAYVCCRMQMWACRSLFFFFTMCVFTKAHSFSVIEHTQPVKTIRATGLENVQAAPMGRDSNSRWYCIGSVEIQHELKARHWRLLMMFLWNYTGCPWLAEQGKATDEWLFWRFPMHHCVSVSACVHACC